MKLVIYFFFLSIVICSSTPPNVIVIVADDLGYDDISWHNPKIVSPNLQSLADDGIILENHYVLHVCSPTRSALMTSYYPIHTGRHSGVIKPEMPKGLFTNFTIMPEYFKEIGYYTHAIGKWHLGFCNENYLPTRRGFDTFYGFYLGEEDHYVHNRVPNKGDKSPGYDFHDQDDVDYSANGTYSSILFGERAVKVIKDHAQNHEGEPLFMYLPYQNVHAPCQVPIEYEELYPNIENKKRRVLSAMVSAMDDSVGTIINTLRETEMLDNTIIVFTSDNGAPFGNGGSNYPLRGTKGSLCEGGMKAAAFVYSSMLKNKGSTSNELIHVIDWVPTLLSAVKDKLSNDNQKKVDHFLSEDRDGIDQWSVLMGHEEGQRTEFLYNIDPKYSYQGVEGHGAIRVGDYKLIKGHPGKHDGYYPPNNASVDHLDDFDDQNEINLDFYDGKMKFRGDEEEIYLFNLKDDPNEYNNLATANPDLVEELKAKLAEYEATMIPPDTTSEIVDGNPANFGGVWSTGWCDSEPV